VKSVRTREIEIHYLDRGSGPPLLMVHGFPFDHSMWRSQVKSMASRCRVIAPDLRGFGRSPAVGEQVTMEQFADDLAGLLDQIGISEPVVYCGLSMGGYIGFQFWRKYRARLRGLVLCDTRAVAASWPTACFAKVRSR
jgi:pimeloyl-ACP methyl ester carboxylesterase